MNKPHYGIDAPPVIKQLVITGIIALIMGTVIYKLLIHHYPYAAVLILQITFLLFATNFIFSILMFWSSLYGKFYMRDRIIDLLNLHGDEQILDVGCGRGLLLNGIAKNLNKNGKAFGIDIWRSEDLSDNKEIITRQNALLEGISDRIELVTHDMTKMYFRDNQFDAIVSSMAIHNVPSLEGRQAAIQEIHRVLKPGGKLIILDFQCTKEYIGSFKKLNWTNINLSRHYLIMFPPVRLVFGEKPIKGT